ncbi:putative membrane protein [Rhizomicrobium palustre]|uniref:Putative membrane protein n=1 Tax=Rhizomicrobium palustre TaxID=189966 RepID=A0A846MTY2_9PROT|nr:DUF1003 domain-containing protein [Rhizomicrobium palustre]NIK86813.1 putative membrane protein [Rhizomicrobium palustre]
MSHVENARATIHTLHSTHKESATALERWVDRGTAILGRPLALIFLVAAVIVWIGANILAGPEAFDPLPFPELGLVISTAALAIAVLILASQQRADRLADAREKMTLELALQSAQMVSKIIALLEELRRDTPSVPNRIDSEAVDMADRRAETEIVTPSGSKQCVQQHP